MSELEFFSTIGAFVAGFILLVYLFRVRARVIKAVKLQLLKAITKHSIPPKDDVWSYAPGKSKDLV